MLGATLSDGRMRYMMFRGPMAGLMVTVPADLTATDVRFGQGFLSRLGGMMDAALSGGPNGLDEREDQLPSRITAATEQLTELDTRAVMLEKRYLSRFTAMETAIAGLKSTGTYLTNLVAQWNKDG